MSRKISILELPAEIYWIDLGLEDGYYLNEFIDEF
jgi:hypothetical protein